MEVAIKDLNAVNKKHQVVYNHMNTILDSSGNVESTAEIIVAKEKTREGFIKLFVENINYIVNLDENEKTLFFVILSEMNYKNVVYLGSHIKQYILTNKMMGKSSLYKSIKGLVEKKVIYKLSEDTARSMSVLVGKDVFIVNPNLAGKGSFKDLKSLRHTLITEYDFEKLEVKKQFIEESKYLDDNELLNQNVKRISKIDNSLEIIVEDKETSDDIDDIIDTDVTSDSNLSDKLLLSDTQQPQILELQILKEKNKQKELEIKEKELEIRKLELKKKL